jgi:hypothetical protein
VGLKGLDAKTNWWAVNRQSESNFDFEFDCEFSELLKQSPSGKDVNTEAEEATVLEAVTRRQQVKIQQTEKA